jgi:anti-sigma regulatory factor (Ser/Thr protein kinase)
VTADEAGLRRAVVLARRFGRNKGLDDAQIDRLAIVVEEWIANLVEHGDAPAGSRVGIGLAAQDAGIRITLTDGGQPFDPRLAHFEGPNLDRGGGVGLELIRSWCRISDYRRRDGRNRLALEMDV